MGLQDLNFELEYRSNRNNVVTDFYIPALGEAVQYNRAVGYFSSTALIEISKGIGSLLQNGGTINLIASPKLSEDDVKAIQYGYEEREKIINNALLRNFSEPENIFEERRLNLLAYLVAVNKLNIKIAYIDNEKSIGIFHEKLGIISDQYSNVVAFSGSSNETGMAFNYNYEAIDVFCSWKSDESKQRCEKKEDAFRKIWNDTEKGVEVIDFPDVVKERLNTFNIGPVQFNIDKEEGLYEHISKEPSIPNYIHLFDYQLEAIKQWKENKFCGIYDMATGTGKTFTGLASIIELYNSLNKRLSVIIVCPYQHLVEQWVNDIRLFNIDCIVGHSGHRKYREVLKNKIFDYNLGVDNMLCFICTKETFKIPIVQDILSKIRGDTLLIADEAHNMGAEGMRECLKKQFNYRLALSATLERFGDEEGTKVLYDYFGKKCIEYSLSRAIREDKLTPYMYYPNIVFLNDGELDRYRTLTAEIKKCVIVGRNGKKTLNRQGKNLAIERSRVIAGAKGKIELLRELIQPYKDKNHILVYCGATRLHEDDEDSFGKRQIELVTEMLGIEQQMRVSRFTADEDMLTRSMLIRDFSDGDELQGLIAIKCLDEGVNIPSIKTAFILASTTNPKEYIQRRGRVLRKYKGKEYAEIYDFITLPRHLDLVPNLPQEEKDKDLSLIKKELKRVREFGKDSLNPLDSDSLIEQIEDSYGCIFTTFMMEDEDEYE
ncbi:MAG: DEAD/DEAH box helicase family protein [Clostridiales bacterium]|nr:DEAD/DEAH box helicase family protein [Clostridiales bacterium]